MVVSTSISNWERTVLSTTDSSVAVKFRYDADVAVSFLLIFDDKCSHQSSKLISSSSILIELVTMAQQRPNILFPRALSMDYHDDAIVRYVEDREARMMMVADQPPILVLLPYDETNDDDDDLLAVSNSNVSDDRENENKENSVPQQGAAVSENKEMELDDSMMVRVVVERGRCLHENCLVSLPRRFSSIG
jgi:hypothetical protein